MIALLGLTGVIQSKVAIEVARFNYFGRGWFLVSCYSQKKIMSGLGLDVSTLGLESSFAIKS